MSELLNTPSLTPTSFVVGELYYLKSKGELTVLTVIDRTPTTLKAEVHTPTATESKPFQLITA
jgi:hypothetical protein